MISDSKVMHGYLTKRTKQQKPNFFMKIECMSTRFFTFFVRFKAFNAHSFMIQ